MGRQSSVTGLEIDPAAIHAAVVAVNGHLEVKQAALAPLDAGIVRDGEVQDVAALSEALKQLFRDHRDLDKRVRVGIANAKIVVRVIKLPPIADPKQLDQAVRFQAQDEIPMPLDQAVLDWQALDVVDTPDGPRQRIALVAARRDMVTRVLTAVRDAGLKPQGIDLSAFAMVRALHRGALPDETVVYLSVGGMTNLALAQGTTCEFTRVLGGGLEQMALELADRNGFSLEQARAHIEHPELGNDELIAAEARAITFDAIRTMAREIRGSIEYHHQTGLEAPVTRVVLTGPAASIPGFADQLSGELMLPVEVGVVDAPAGIDAGRLATAAGLAIEEAIR